jgi:hypothetical protein
MLLTRFNVSVACWNSYGITKMERQNLSAISGSVRDFGSVGRNAESSLLGL